MPLQLEPLLDTQLVGRQILCFDCVDSTNTLAARYAADPANDGLVILAEEQTAGRGRLGRRWFSPPGSGILLSILLFPPEGLRRAGVLTALASVTVCETIYQFTQLQATIKWPNDVLVKGKKVCGVLVEQVRRAGGISPLILRVENESSPSSLLELSGNSRPPLAVVIGIGLNVNVPAEVFHAAQLPEAASLCMFTSGPLNRAEITRTLIRQLDTAYAELRRGLLSDLEARWRWHSGLLGKHITVQTPRGTHQGRLVELNFSAVVLEEGDQIRTLNPETVEQILPVSSFKTSFGLSLLCRNLL